MLIFEERGKPEYPEKNLSEQSIESTHKWHLVWESTPGNIGGRRTALTTQRTPALVSRDCDVIRHENTCIYIYIYIYIDIWANLLKGGYWNFRLSTGIARVQAIVASQNWGGLPSRPALPNSPGTVLTMSCVSKAQGWGGGVAALRL